MSTPTRNPTPSDPSTPGTTSRKAKTIVWVVLAAVVLAGLIVGVVAASGPRDAAPQGSGQTASSGTGQSAPSEATPVMRPDSRVLSKAPNEQAVLVEFLDFECEACRAAYPFVEELRAEYSDTVTFVNRYFPLPGHRNSMPAAVAVEAAAQQGQYEAMYQRMFETQSEWGESAEDNSAVFRGFAEDLGLDMEQYRADVKDPAIKKRIEQSTQDAQELGVTGTPTFFLDGEKIEPSTIGDFETKLDAAIED